MMNEIIGVNYDGDKPTVSARELYDKIGSTERFSSWFERQLQYGFEENKDYTSVKTFTVVNNGAKRELDDYDLTIETAKEICIVQKNEKAREIRRYLIKLDEAWNDPQQVLSRALKIAEANISSLKQKNTLLIEENDVLSTENDLLSQKNLEWADRAVINALVRTYGHGIGDDYKIAWRDFKKELLYRHGININARITNYLNKTGRRTKPKTLDMLDDSELAVALSTITAMCRENGVDISDTIKKKLK